MFRLIIIIIIIIIIIAIARNIVDTKERLMLNHHYCHGEVRIAQYLC